MIAGSVTPASEPLRLNSKAPLGLIAGNGLYPLQIAKEAGENSLEVVAVAHVGETDPSIAERVKRCEWVRVGQLGKIIKVFKQSGVKQAVFAGGISRVRLFGGVRLDWTGMRVLARLRSVRDDALLRGIAEEVERAGIEVISGGLLLSEWLAPAGLLTNRSLSAEEKRDAALGWRVAKAVGSHDIGQTVVICQGLVVAVEAVEGTDETIQRAGELTRSRRLRQGTRAGAEAPVVVKVFKPNQDERLDLPTVGLRTIEVLREAGAHTLVLEVGKTLILEPHAVIEAANRAGIAIMGVRSAEELE